VETSNRVPCTRRQFLASASATAAAGLLSQRCSRASEIAGSPEKETLPELVGNRFLTFNAVVRVNQIEVARNRTAGSDEGPLHTPELTKRFRETIERGWPGARITWAFSWLALQDQRPNYKAIRELVVEYHKRIGDEITFIPGGYFQPMYNPRAATRNDLHDALQKVSDMVGGGYRPRSVVAGFLDASSLQYLAETEKIHVCQGTIWSQYSVDNGDGDGSVCYPYYPSKEHFCKPAQGPGDFIDCVNLDGWTCDFLAARRAGFADGFNSRMGVGPIETLLSMDQQTAVRELMHTTAIHFDRGFDLNRFGWVTTCWEASLVGLRGAAAKQDLDGLVQWFTQTRKRWPEAKLVTQGEFGEAWRKHYRDNAFDYRFQERGSGIGGSDANMEIRWLMNKDFRLALLRDWKAGGKELVIDFTRYDLKVQEPVDATFERPTRNWSLMNRINMKRSRPQDQPVPLAKLSQDDRDLIARRYPKLTSK
jgi:hypothetical protein